MRTLLNAFFCLIFGVALFSLFSSTAQAATYHICSSGCDYTSINTAFGFASPGDTFIVDGAGPTAYDPTTESFNIIFPDGGATIECTGGATIEQTTPDGNNFIYLKSNSIINNCNLSNIILGSYANSGTAPDGIQITNNTFNENATSTIAFSQGGTNFIIQNNQYIGEAWLQTTSTDGLIQNNLFKTNGHSFGGGIIFNTSASSSNISIIGNTFYNDTSSYGGTNFLSINGENITFATNTIRYLTEPTSGMIAGSLSFSASGTHNYIGGNFIDSPGSRGSSCGGVISVYPYQSNGDWHSTVTIAHNTIRVRGNCVNGIPIRYSDIGMGVLTVVGLNIHYNLIDNETVSSTIDAPAIEIRGEPANSITLTHDYNGAYKFSSILKKAINGVGMATDNDVHGRTSNPFLAINDLISSNDQLTAPFSEYLDVNGTLDIGATNIARRNTTNINSSGPINYVSIDATSTADIPHYIRTGDSVTIAAGTYPSLTLGSDVATSTITITGAGATTTFINANENDNAVTLNNLTSSTLSNFSARNASSTGSTQYSATVLSGHIGSANYNEAILPIGLSANSNIYFYGSSDCDQSIPLASDGGDITVATLGGTTGFHAAFVNLMGSHATFLFASSVFADETAVDAFLSGVCGVPATIDGFADNIFTTDGATYSYDNSSLVSSGATLAPGVTDPPSITNDTPVFSAIKFAGATNNVSVSNVSTTQSSYGVWFTGTTHDNTVSNSSLSSMTLADIFAESNATNTVDNTSFSRTSSIVNGSSTVLVKFRLRGQALRASNDAALIPTTMVATDASGVETSLGTTGAGGYTPYVSLPAYTITSASDALTHGGYNAYSLAASSTNYATTSTEVTLASVNQLQILRLISSIAPTAPSSATISPIGSSTGTLSWDDNSSDELGFGIDLINLSTGETFPGSSFTTSSDVTSYTFTGLIPNQQYRARVHALGESFNSAYSTSSVVRTLAAQPSAPTISGASQTTATITINSNGNSSSTEYSIYNETLGNYLDGSGAASTVAIWQTTSTWSTVTASSLSCGTSYSFSIDARNADAVVSATSTAGSASTSACPVVSGGGSGGGGGGGGNYLPPATIFNIPATSTPITPPVTAPAPSPVIIIPTAPPTTLPLPSVPASEGARTNISSNARSFGISLSESQLEGLARFVDHGTTPETIALGSGERLAMLRDLFDTLRRAPSITDLERNASGQLPLSRNLAQERLQLPRVRQTFRSIYGHDPNFKNANENLAWNTLMYRIRFPRNLSAEREGAQTYRQLFRGTPQDPFQWATVRALGYIE